MGDDLKNIGNEIELDQVRAHKPVLAGQIHNQLAELNHIRHHSTVRENLGLCLDILFQTNDDMTKKEALKVDLVI